MRSIKKQFLYCLTGAIFCVGIAIWFTCISVWSAAILFAVVAIILAVFALRASKIYQATRLICENPILNVGVASVVETGGDNTAESLMNVVISGFGILINGKPYTFGHDGIKLTSVAIDRESISLSFGDVEKKYSVRLLHGLADKADIDKLKERLRYETGVIAHVNGW